ncbi:MAG: hypothetical protein KatS3mg038_1151 [Candidatus Kapaibacterium sp.]|nr:MAG: hypothetical protein KatS3mg038_1151 [Candidatus Kapabacteria bacterium]
MMYAREFVRYVAQLIGLQPFAVCIAQQLAALGVHSDCAPRTERIEWHAWFGADVRGDRRSPSLVASRWSLDLVLVGSR